VVMVIKIKVEIFIECVSIKKDSNEASKPHSGLDCSLFQQWCRSKAGLVAAELNIIQLDFLESFACAPTTDNFTYIPFSLL
jgi:hypothetical protein